MICTTGIIERRSKRRAFIFEWNEDAFSLIELLMVMTIISLLFGLTTLSISGVSQSRNLTSGGNLVVSLTQQARQNSITKQALTALVLAPVVADSEFNSRIFCLMELSSGATRWTQISAWQILPQGVIVDSYQSAVFFNSPNLSPDLPSIPFRGTAVTSIVYQVFNPDGSLYVGNSGQPASSPILKLVLSKSNLPNYYEISLNILTGIPRIDRL